MTCGKGPYYRSIRPKHLRGRQSAPLLQGGIVAVYYLPGTLAGAFWGGWLGDRYGRIFTIAFATLWAIVGAALQCSAQNADWMFCARVFNGIGTGILNAITPQFKRLAAMQGDAIFEGPRRFFLQERSSLQPTWSFCEPSFFTLCVKSEMYCIFRHSNQERKGFACCGLGKLGPSLKIPVGLSDHCPGSHV